MPKHSEAVGVENHTPIAFTYADAAARVAEPALPAVNLLKFAFQQDDDSVWLLTGISPNVWTAVGAVGGMTAATAVSLSALGGAAFANLQVMQDVYHSTGAIEGAAVTDAGSGLITVTGGEGYIRASSDSLSTLFAIAFPASTAGLVVLTDLQTSWVYVEYNGGTPRIIATTSERTDSQSNILLARIYREGTTLHINSTVRHVVADHAGLMIRRLTSTQPFARESGASLSETGTRNVGVSAGVFWEGLTRFLTAAFDSSGADNFSYWYDDGAAGWTEVNAQSQFDNLQYDDGTGTLATLANNQYGVHWVYLSTDDDVHLIYGVDSYTLLGAQAAPAPAALPTEITTDARLIGRIIVQKSAASATDVSSVFDTTFEAGSTNVHNDLTGLQGGAAGEYNHLTNAELAALSTYALATGGTFKDVTEVVHTAATVDIDPANGNVQVRTLAGNETFTFTGITAGQAVLLVVIPGANTLTLTNVAKWTGDAPASIDAEHWLVISNVNGTIVGTDIGGVS